MICVSGGGEDATWTGLDGGEHKSITSGAWWIGLVKGVGSAAVSRADASGKDVRIDGGVDMGRRGE